jgi:hypothetical protein
MKAAIVAGGLALAGLVIGVGSRLSADALGMAVGMVFGVLASVPMALLVLAANNRRMGDDDYEGQALPAVLRPDAQEPPVNHYHLHVHGGNGVAHMPGVRPAAYITAEHDGHQGGNL